MAALPTPRPTSYCGIPGKIQTGSADDSYTFLKVSLEFLDLRLLASAYLQLERNRMIPLEERNTGQQFEYFYMLWVEQWVEHD